MHQNSQSFDPLSLAYRPENDSPKKKLLQFAAKRKMLWIMVSVVLIVALGSGGFMYYKYQKTQNTPDKIAQREAQKQADEVKKKNDDMIATVKNQIALPTNEQPVLATVSDKNALQNQTFFKAAQDGDRILMYPKNKKIFLYRPSTKQVLAQAPLKYTVGQTDPTASVAGTETTTAVSTAPAQPLTPNPTIIPHGKILVQPQ